METMLDKWIEYAEGDLEAAEILLEHPKSDRSWQMVMFHCHEAVEKLLKAVLIKKEKEVKKIHDLNRLYELTGIELPEEHRAYIEELEPYYPGQRYPDLPVRSRGQRFDKLVADYHVKKTKNLFLWVKQHHLT